MKSVVTILSRLFRSFSLVFKEAPSWKLLSLIRRQKNDIHSCPWPTQSRGFDWVLFAVVVSAVLFGLLMVYSSSFIFAQERTGDGYAFIKRQVIYAAMGFCALFFGYRVHYHQWLKWSYQILGIIFVLLFALWIPGLGVKAGGATRWLNLGIFRVQPAELCKVAFILFVSRHLYLKRDRIHLFRAGVLGTFLVPLPGLILLLLQPDFGSAAVIVFVTLGLLFLSGANRKHLILTSGLGLIAGIVLIASSPYRWARFTAFLDPWKDPTGKGFQVLQSLVGIHNGSLWGVGLGNGKEKLFFLPEAHNDFILAVVGEELGFFGLAGVIALFTFFLYRGFRIASRSWVRHGDLFGFFFGAGLTLLIGIQAFTNIAVVLGLLPTKGLSLPFVSYGGSSLVVNLFVVGILLNIGLGPRNSKISEKLS
tara:strand:- start:171 stop:1433 length:1263 start_codon:yes stop_codon:yes gene_type:complete